MALEKVDTNEYDIQNLVNYLQVFILKRGWRLKIAKKTQVEQSLFIHAMNELGAIQKYLQVYPHPFNESEIKKIYIASILHDCEKETVEWQEKVRLGEKPPHHTNPEYAKKFINELINFLTENGIVLDLSQDDLNDIISSQPLHMTGASKNPHIVFEELSRKHKSERWSEIANLIDLFDDIVSIESVESSIALLDKDEYRMLNERLEFTYHKISNVRGILTSLLHKACEKAYEMNGFTPYLYYFDGTLYFRVRRNEPDEKVFVNEIKIKDSLKTVINEFIRNIENDNKVVIENPQTKLFRGRDFFDKELIDKYFFNLQRKYRPKVDKDGLKKLILSNFNSLEHAKEQLNIQEIKDSEIIDSIFQNINIYSEKFPKFSNEFIETYNIGISKPQQYIFQIFKEIIEELEINKTVIADIEKEYNSFFGNGKYLSLKSLTNDPKKNFKLFIEPFWEKEIEVNSNKLKIKMLDAKKQQEILSKTLCDILKNNISKCSKLPKDDFADEIANLIISDLIYPCNINVNDTDHYAKQQIDIIGISKAKLFNKTKGERLCPVCYKIMPEANLITAAFLSNENGVAKVFNNQGIAGSAFGGSVNICRLCYAEILLRRVILGRTPSELIILFPSLNFAKIQASRIIELTRDIQNKLGQFYSYNNPNQNERIRFYDFRNLTLEILERNIEQIEAELDPNKFIDTFKIEIGDKGREVDIKKLVTLLKDWWEDSIDRFNKEFSTNYNTFNQIAEDIFENKCPIPEMQRNQIIEEANVNPDRYSFVYETPNFLVICLPMTFSYSKDEAEVNILFKRYLFASYLYLLTDCAVMVISGKEIIHIPQKRNMVYIQPNATMKQIIKEEWVSLFDLEKWMIAISAAVKLSYEGDYSNRTGIFEVLNQPTVGHILSRITSQKTPSGATKRADARLINILDKLQHSEVLRNETIVNSKI